MRQPIAIRIEYAFDDSPLGLLLAARTEKGLCAALLGDDREALLADLRRRFRGAVLVENWYALAEALRAIRQRIEDARSTEPELDLHGTDFQRRVWQVLLNVPAGTTVSYAQLAQLVGRPESVRAVAGAVAANHLAVLVPCHRVIRSDGQLSGYRWGPERKRELLAREAARKKQG